MYVASATHFSCAIRHRDIAEVKKMEKMVSRRLEPSSNILFIVKLIRGGSSLHKFRYSIEYCSQGMLYHLIPLFMLQIAKCYSKDPLIPWLLVEVESIDLVCIGIVVFQKA